jgi:antitoxin ParD1/3/4
VLQVVRDEDEWKAWIEERITSGRYNNASEVVREALRLLEFQEREARLRDLQGAIRERLESPAAPWGGRHRYPAGAGPPD